MGDEFTARRAPSYVSKSKRTRNEPRINDVLAASLIINFGNFTKAKRIPVEVQKRLTFDGGLIA